MSIANTTLPSHREPRQAHANRAARAQGDGPARSEQPDATRFIVLVLAVAVVIVVAGVAGVLLAFA